MIIQCLIRVSVSDCLEDLNVSSLLMEKCNKKLKKNTGNENFHAFQSQAKKDTFKLFALFACGHWLSVSPFCIWAVGIKGRWAMYNSIYGPSTKCYLSAIQGKVKIHCICNGKRRSCNLSLSSINWSLLTASEKGVSLHSFGPKSMKCKNSRQLSLTSWHTERNFSLDCEMKSAFVKLGKQMSRLKESYDLHKRWENNHLASESPWWPCPEAKVLLVRWPYYKGSVASGYTVRTSSYLQNFVNKICGHFISCFLLRGVFTSVTQVAKRSTQWQLPISQMDKAIRTPGTDCRIRLQALRRNSDEKQCRSAQLSSSRATSSCFLRERNLLRGAWKEMKELYQVVLGLMKKMYFGMKWKWTNNPAIQLGKKNLGLVLQKCQAQ